MSGLHLFPTLALAASAFAVATAAYLLSTSTIATPQQRRGYCKPSVLFLVLMFLSAGVVNLVFLFRFILLTHP